MGAVYMCVRPIYKDILYLISALVLLFTNLCFTLVTIFTKLCFSYKFYTSMCFQLETQTASKFAISNYSLICKLEIYMLILDSTYYRMKSGITRAWGNSSPSQIELNLSGTTPYGKNHPVCLEWPFRRW